MSFSSDVKKELLSLYSPQKHCQLAETAAMLSGAGVMEIAGGRMHILFVTENELTADKYVRLLYQAVGITASMIQVPYMQQKNKPSYLVKVSEEEAVYKLLSSLKLLAAGDGSRERKPLLKDDAGRKEPPIEGLTAIETTQPQQMPLTDGRLLQKSCCKRAFLRGAFLTAGSMSNPKKSYHFEIVCGNRIKAQQLQEQFQHFSLEAKIISRKNHEVVYVKEGAQIVDALNIMGAHAALMDLENVRIIKEMRNDINRRVNCETANINKTVHAAYRQQEAIRFLQQNGVLGRLSAQLQEIAALRMEYPEASIQELGTLCRPEVGKSGVNHRLRKLEELAGQMGHERKSDRE